jgi:hypothetical protein
MADGCAPCTGSVLLPGRDEHQRLSTDSDNAGIRPASGFFQDLLRTVRPYHSSFEIPEGKVLIETGCDSWTF